MTAGIKANADGSAAIQVGGSDAISITSGLNTTFAGTVTSPTGTLYPLVSGAAQTAPFTAPNTYADFTGIPSTAKRITVMFSGVSTSGTSIVQVQLGDSGGIETTAYESSNSIVTGTNTCSLAGMTTGISTAHALAVSARNGALIFNLLTGNTWVAFGLVSDRNNNNATAHITGTKSLSDTLTQVRVTTVNGTDTFDAGTINIMWE